MKVIIAGSREFNDYSRLRDFCDRVLDGEKDIEVVSGTAKGADQMGERYAKERGYPVKRFPANWGKHGKGAGMIRNNDMADYGDALIAFWDGRSRGTKHIIAMAVNRKLKTDIDFF